VSRFRTARLAARGLSTFCESGSIRYGPRSPRRDPHPKTAGLWPSALAAATYASGRSADARLTLLGLPARIDHENLPSSQ
jgi:hypothetical protein